MERAEEVKVTIRTSAESASTSSATGWSFLESWLVRGFARALGQLRGKVGIALIGTTVMTAVLAPVLAPFDPLEMHPEERFRAPSWKYPFGTDEFGRDLLSRVIHGTRVSLSVGVLSVGIALIAGVVLGASAGYFGGTIDAVIMRIQDSLLAFPGILLAVTIVAILGSGFANVLLAVAIINVPRFARVARSGILMEKPKEYVLASRAFGASSWHIVSRDILPNILSPLIVQTTASMASAVLLEAGLSFLGVGNPPPSPSWGGTLSIAKRYLFRAPWYGIFPGMAISVLLLGFYLLDDALQQGFRTRLQRIE